MGVNLSGLLRELTFEYFNIAFGKINYFRSGMNLDVIVVVVVGGLLVTASMAAYIDGAGLYHNFFRIVFPMLIIFYVHRIKQ